MHPVTSRDMEAYCKCNLKACPLQCGSLCTRLHRAGCPAGPGEHGNCKLQEAGGCPASVPAEWLLQAMWPTVSCWPRCPPHTPPSPPARPSAADSLCGAGGPRAAKAIPRSAPGPCGVSARARCQV